MTLIRRISLITSAGLFALLLSGCDTQDELNQQRLDFLTAQEKALVDLKAFLDSKPALSGPGVVNFFISADAINSVLAGADNLKFPIAQVPGATVTLKSLRTAFTTGFPAISASATIRKDGLDAALDVSISARLEPVIDPKNPGTLTLKIYVDSIVPTVTWSVLDIRLRGFVHDLLQVKLNDQLRNAGSISIPIQASVPLALPAKSTPVSFPGVSAILNTPAISLQGSVALNRIITLPDGLHVLGRIAV
jgi:hypothetical protein